MPRLMAHAEKSFDNADLNAAAKALYNRLEWYTQYTDKPLIVLATVLDPRVKDKFLPDQARYIARDLLASHIPDNLELNSSFDSQVSVGSQQFQELNRTSESIYDGLFIVGQFSR